jgi:protein-L-isoaspartate(D-aspartate) O-methyltransferase
MNKIDEAMRMEKREHFLPDEIRDQALIDAALPIGHGQTNSQPSTVRAMLEWLDPQPGETVLDVGSGSGWTAALLAYLVGPDGHVYGVENVPALVSFASRNIRKRGIKNAEILQAGSHHGLPEHSPFDRILVSAAARNVPEDLQHQLAVDGVMVIPVQHSILVMRRKSETEFQTEEHHGFSFVPLI